MAFDPITYNGLVTAIQNLVVDNGSTAFTGILPQMIQFSENKCYQSLDLLSSRGTDNSVALTPNVRTATLPADMNIVEGISAITPYSNPTGKRNPVERTSIDFIDMAYPDPTITGLPTWYAMLSDTTIVFAPTPDHNYYIECTGTVDPPPMSAAQQTSPLGNYFPDLLLSASMIFMSAWQRDFGSQMNPQDANLWQTAFDGQLKSALEYIQRQKAQTPNWSPFSATPESTPRG